MFRNLQRDHEPGAPFVSQGRLPEPEEVPLPLHDSEGTSTPELCTLYVWILEVCQPRSLRKEDIDKVRNNTFRSSRR